MYTIRTLRVAELLSRVSARNCWFCVVVWAFRLLISRLCICVGCVFCFRLCWCLSEVHRSNIQPPTHAKSIDNSLLTTTTTTQCHSKIILKEEEEATEAIPNNRDTMPDHARRERGNLLHQRRCKWRHRASNNSREVQKLSNREDNTKLIIDSASLITAQNKDIENQSGTHPNSTRLHTSLKQGPEKNPRTLEKA